MGRSILPSVLLSLLLSSRFVVGSCPLHGPVFPLPTNLSGSPVIKDAMQNITNTISAGFESGNSSYGLVDPTAAYTVQIFSLESEEPLLEYYHDGSTLSTTGVQKVDGDSIFRIGSISKLFTIYLFLADLGDGLWNDPITKHIPELRNRTKSEVNPVDYVDWDQITLGALAGHTAGLPRDFVDLLGLYANTDPSLGLPILPPSEYPACIQTAEKNTCDRKQFFDAINDRQPTFLPNTKAVYSNTGFMLLGYALESITGKSYEDILKTVLIDQLGLTGTSYSKPEDSKGVIPFNTTVSQWAVDGGDGTPMGGLYASTNDLSRVGRSILNSTLLDDNTTRAWLKPTSFTSSLYGDVGRPWEIFRAADVGPSKRLIDLYTKGGDIGLYHTALAVVPDYNIGFAIAIGGSESSALVFPENLIVETLFPALEIVARQQADQIYAGTYTATNGLNSSLVLNTDAQLPGLGLSEWISNGTDMLGVLAAVGSIKTLTPSAVRMYPTNLERKTENGTEVAWRMVVDTQAGAAMTGPFSACGTWFSVDVLALGKNPIDEFLFALSGDGEEKAVSVDLRAFDIVLERQR